MERRIQMLELALSISLRDKPSFSEQELILINQKDSELVQEVIARKFPRIADTLIERPSNKIMRIIHNSAIKRNMSHESSLTEGTSDNDTDFDVNDSQRNEINDFMGTTNTPTVKQDSDAERLKRIRDDPNFIRFIENPTDEDFMQAIESDSQIILDLLDYENLPVFVIKRAIEINPMLFFALDQQKITKYSEELEMFMKQRFPQYM